MLANQDKVLIAVVLAVVIAISITIPLVDEQSKPKSGMSDEQVTVLGATWQNILISSIEVSVAGAKAASGFVSASITTLPNVSATAQERIAGQYFERFDDYAKLLLAANPIIISMQLRWCGLSNRAAQSQHRLR